MVKICFYIFHSCMYIFIKKKKNFPREFYELMHVRWLYLSNDVLPLWRRMHMILLSVISQNLVQLFPDVFRIYQTNTTRSTQSIRVKCKLNIFAGWRFELFYTPSRQLMTTQIVNRKVIRHSSFKASKVNVIIFSGITSPVIEPNSTVEIVLWGAGSEAENHSKTYHLVVAPRWIQSYYCCCCWRLLDEPSWKFMINSRMKQRKNYCKLPKWPLQRLRIIINMYI